MCRLTVVLLHVGEACDGLALDQPGTVGQSDVHQGGDPVAERRRRFLGLVEGAQGALDVFVLPEGEHGLATTMRMCGRSSRVTGATS